MSDFRVSKIGHDPNGRPIFMTTYMRLWWATVCHELGFTPTIVQGAFMARAGGGADASAGYHDLAGCLDLRVWNLTDDQVEKTIRTLRRHGAAAWLRDKRHGMDPHIHLVLGTDHPLAAGAAYQWRQYVRGRNGLADDGPDYHWRPRPLVIEPPEDDMPYTEEQLEEIMARAAQRGAEAALRKFGLDRLPVKEKKRADRELADDRDRAEQLDRIEGT